METAKRQMSKMAVGNITIMWDLVVYRVSVTKWIVGETISVQQRGDSLDHAAKSICEICMGRA